MEFLKSILGDELYAQVADKLKGSEIKLADLSGGAYVGREKFDALNEQVKAARSDIAARDQQLEALRKTDPEKLQAEITRLQGENSAAKEAAEKRIADLETDIAVQAYTSNIKFTSELARKAFIADFKAQGFKRGEDGTFQGADDYTKGIREKNPSAFEPEKNGGAGLTGGAPMPPGENANSFMNSLIRGTRGGE